MAHLVGVDVDFKGFQVRWDPLTGHIHSGPLGSAQGGCAKGHLDDVFGVALLEVIVNVGADGLLNPVR